MQFKITYHMHPEKDIVVLFTAKSEEEAIIFAKQYRKDAFSVSFMEENAEQKGKNHET